MDTAGLSLKVHAENMFLANLEFEVSQPEFNALKRSFTVISVLAEKYGSEP